MLAGADSKSPMPKFVAVDDVHRMDDNRQAGLFALYNRWRESAATGRARGRRRARCPCRCARTCTRLGWDLVFRLDPLSDADKLAALSAQAAERGMHLAPEIINWMLTHHERDIRKLAALIDALDRYSWPTAAPSPCPCARHARGPRLATQMTSPRLALFDLDHTLLPLDSDYQWADYLARTGRAGDPDEARRRNDELMERYNRES